MDSRQTRKSSTEDDQPLSPMSPSLPLVGGERFSGRSEESWCRKVVDVEEAHRQILFALPLVLTNVFYYLIPLVSVMYAGHLGELQLAASTLANSWGTVSGFAFMLGLSGALETLCGQGFGAQQYNLLGIYLQASCMISFFFSIIISVLWWNTEAILIALYQHPDVARESAVYMKWLIPGIIAYGLLQNMLIFLQTQSVVIPLGICSLIALLLNIALGYVLVHLTPLGYRGAPLATSISYWTETILLMFYIGNAKKLERTWKGLSVKSFHYVFANLRLALPSAAMICLEYWAFEVLVFLAGLLPDSKNSTSLIALCVNTEAIGYCITYALSATASTRVSNELGADSPNKAKHAMIVTLKLSVLLTIIMILGLAIGHDVWASLFSSETNIIEAFGSMTPLLCVAILLDCVQGILSGVIRGMGWQQLTMFINLGTFYGIGVPVALLLGFKLKLYAKGLWIGLICGLGSQACILVLVTCYKKWIAVELPSK